MAEHRATPTQTAYPWRATIRTIVEVGLPAFGVALLVAPQILQIIAEELGGVLPEGATAWMLAAAATVTLVSGALARIAAIPGVNALLSRIGLGATPKGYAPPVILDKPQHRATNDGPIPGEAPQ